MLTTFTTVDEVIATAQSTIKTADSFDKQLFRQWLGTMCLPMLGISEDDVKVVSLYPVNYSVPKPDDLRAIIDISCFDANGCQLAHEFRTGGKRIYADTRLARTAVAGGTITDLNRCVPVDVSETNFSLELGTNATHVATILLRYYYFPVDEAGLPLIKMLDMLACVYFLRYMFALRENENQSEIQAAEMRWKLESDRCRAQKKMLSISPDKMKKIINGIWMRAIPDFNFSRF